MYIFLCVKFVWFFFFVCLKFQWGTNVFFSFHFFQHSNAIIFQSGNWLTFLLKNNHCLKSVKKLLSIEHFLCFCPDQNRLRYWIYGARELRGGQDRTKGHPTVVRGIRMVLNLWRIRHSYWMTYGLYWTNCESNRHSFLDTLREINYIHTYIYFDCFKET